MIVRFVYKWRTFIAATAVMALVIFAALRSYTPATIRYRTLPNVTSSMRRKTVIVSGANSGYFNGLKNLIGSIHYWEPMRPIVVYNIGLREYQLYELSQMCQVYVHWPDGIPRSYPDHVNDPHVYAWKTMVIKDAVDRYKKIFWMDGGSDIRGKLDKLDEDLTRDGFFFIGQRGDDLNELLHRGMYDYLELKRSDFEDKGVYAGGYQGYVKDGYAYHHVLERLFQCSYDKNCISPPGASLSNHRFDQSALSIFVHTSLNMTSRRHDDYEYFTRDYFDDDPLKSSKVIIYSARAKSQEYVKFIRRITNEHDCLEIV